MHAPTQVALKSRRVPRDRVRLLVVDQDEGMRSVLAQLLMRAGYAVQTAGTADEALRSNQELNWDCLITELELPGVGGLELYAHLLFKGRPQLPVVFLSAWPPATLELGLRQAGWVRLLRKPCAFTDLLAALERCLSAPRAP
jgi:FixJ family two-component response regulator